MAGHNFLSLLPVAQHPGPPGPAHNRYQRLAWHVLPAICGAELSVATSEHIVLDTGPVSTAGSKLHGSLGYAGSVDQRFAISLTS